jgi:hypothetical protein
MKKRTRIALRRYGGWRAAAIVMAFASALVLARVAPLGASAPASASLGAAQSFGAANPTASATLTASTATATGSGDLLVAVVRDRDTTALASVVAITDSAVTNTWSLAVRTTQGTQADEEIWYAANAASVSSVTVTMSDTSAIAMTVVDVAGASTTAPRTPVV